MPHMHNIWNWQHIHLRLLSCSWTVIIPPLSNASKLNVLQTTTRQILLTWEISETAPPPSSFLPLILLHTNMGAPLCEYAEGLIWNNRGGRSKGSFSNDPGEEPRQRLKGILPSESRPPSLKQQATLWHQTKTQRMPTCPQPSPRWFKMSLIDCNWCAQ